MALVPPHTHPRHEHAQYASYGDGPSRRNRIINGDFSVNQRGFTSATSPTAPPSTYGFDRWGFTYVGGTVTYSAQAASLGDLPESSRNFARMSVSGQSAAADNAGLFQRIEYVKSLSGKTATVSFWAKATSGTPKVAVEFGQRFGTGGTPSAAVSAYAGQATLSTEWKRYSVTASVPSISGKTLGTAGDDHVVLFLWVSAGSDLNSRTGSLGIQSTTIDFWGVQVEEGSVATPFEQKPYAQELRDCQRYYVRMNQSGGASRYAMGNAATTTNWDGVITLPVPMRAQPSITLGGSLWALSDAATLAMTSVTVGTYPVCQPAFPHNQIWITKTGGTGTLVAQRMYYLENQGGTGAYLELNAEL